jgi:hypothetical protein
VTSAPVDNRFYCGCGGDDKASIVYDWREDHLDPELKEGNAQEQW